MPWPISLVVKKGFEDALTHLLGHADAVVLDLDFSPGRIEAGAQDNAPRLVIVTLVDGLGGILQQVEQHLFQLVSGDRYRAELRVEFADDSQAFEVEAFGEVEVVAGNFHRLVDQAG